MKDFIKNNENDNVIVAIKELAEGEKFTVDGKEYGRYQLSSEQEIQINETNVLEIRDGKAKMKSADCPDQICVHQKAISRNGESIICLPNKIVLKIVDGEEAELDAVTN